MRAKSAPLGIVAAVALSSAAGALPCAQTFPATRVTAAVHCTAAGNRDGAVNPGGAAEQEPDTIGDPLATDAAEQVADLAELGAFAQSAVKITNLQATMTSNIYVAGQIPPVPQASSTQELMMYAPDYMSVKLSPRPPTRKPVGVGLVTLPKPAVKKSDILPDPEQPAKPAQ